MTTSHACERSAPEVPRTASQVFDESDAMAATVESAEVTLPCLTFALRPLWINEGSVQALQGQLPGAMAGSELHLLCSSDLLIHGHFRSLPQFTCGYLGVARSAAVLLATLSRQFLSLCSRASCSMCLCRRRRLRVRRQQTTACWPRCLLLRTIRPRLLWMPSSSSRKRNR